MKLEIRVPPSRVWVAENRHPGCGVTISQLWDGGLGDIPTIPLSALSPPPRDRCLHGLSQSQKHRDVFSTELTSEKKEAFHFC